MSDEINELKAAEKAKLETWQWSESYRNDDSPFVSAELIKQVDTSQSAPQSYTGLALFARTWLPFILIMLSAAVLATLNGHDVTAIVRQYWIVIALLAVWGKGNNNRGWIVPACFLMMAFAAPTAVAGIWWMLLLVPIFMMRDLTSNV